MQKFVYKSFRMDIEEHVIKEVIPKELLLPDVKIHMKILQDDS